MPKKKKAQKPCQQKRSIEELHKGLGKIFEKELRESARFSGQDMPVRICLPSVALDYLP